MQKFEKFLDYFAEHGSIPVTIHPDTVKKLAIALGIAAGGVVLLWAIVRKF